MQISVGIIAAALVAIVVIGGIKRIGSVTSKMVPAMCIGYCLVCLYIVLSNIGHVPHLISDIVVSAWSGEALFGGVIGVMVQGMKRAASQMKLALVLLPLLTLLPKPTNQYVRAVAMLGPHRHYCGVYRQP